MNAGWLIPWDVSKGQLWNTRSVTLPPYERQHCYNKGGDFHGNLRA